MTKLKHHLGNFPTCQTCPHYKTQHETKYGIVYSESCGAKSKEGDGFICKPVKEHIAKMKQELAKIREKDSRKMGGDLANYFRISVLLGEEK